MGALTAITYLYVQGGATAARPSPAARVAALWEGVWSDAWVHVNEQDSLVHEASCAGVLYSGIREVKPSHIRVSTRRVCAMLMPGV